MQFTTDFEFAWLSFKLFSKSKSTRFRCNSQQITGEKFAYLGCFQRAKVQDLDAIHNAMYDGQQFCQLFSKSKSTRFRCNSQPTFAVEKLNNSCFQRAKVQDLDAIHNIQRVNYFLAFMPTCIQWHHLKPNNHYHSAIIMRLCHRITLVN